LGIAVLVIIVVTRTNRRLGRVAQDNVRDVNSWSANCIDPDHPQAERVLIVDRVGLRVLGTPDVLPRSWPWAAVSGVSVERVPVALVHHTALVIHLTGQQRVELLLPGRSTLSYPPALARAAAEEILRRRPDARSHSESFDR
jgi:hypothetical protein